MSNIALIIGAGSGLSASLARLFAKEGFTVGLAARRIDKLNALSEEIGAVSFAVDAAKPDEVNQLFNQVEERLGTPTVVIYNAALRIAGPLIELDPIEVAKALEITAYGGFLVAQAAAKRMLKLGAEVYVRLKGKKAVKCAKLHHHNNFRCIFRCGYRKQAMDNGQWKLSDRLPSP